MSSRRIPVLGTLVLLVLATGLQAAETSEAPADSAAPLGNFAVGDGSRSPETGPIGNRPIDLSLLPTANVDPLRLKLQSTFRAGKRPEMPISEAEAAALREQAMSQPPGTNIQIMGSRGPGQNAPNPGTTFDSLNTDDRGGAGANLPPDPELAVGPHHIIAVVNDQFEVYDKSGTTVAGPFFFDTFFTGVSGCSGLFDPNVLYDEKEDRFILGVDNGGGTGNNGYCIAATATNDPTGSWNRYSFDATANGGDFFDYPHAGVGEEAVFMGGNIFGSPFHADVWAIDKLAMYSGSSLPTPVRKELGGSSDTPQPSNLHGFLQGAWPTSSTHYILGETVFNGTSIGVWAWTDPFGANTFSLLGTVDMNTHVGAGGFPIDTPQSGGDAIQGNDFRPLDAEYRNGTIFMSQTVSCNPGGGTVNCVRWAEIDPDTGGGSPAFVQGGIFASTGEFRIFPDVAVNACNDVTIGYTKSSASMFPALYYTGRLGADAPGTLQAEALLKAGEVVYTAFDSAPHRWGDYSGATSDPDGVTTWYLGEYSRNNSSTLADWGTYVGGFTTACATGEIFADGFESGDTSFWDAVSP